MKFISTLWLVVLFLVVGGLNYCGKGGTSNANSAPVDKKTEPASAPQTPVQDISKNEPNKEVLASGSTEVSTASSNKKCSMCHPFPDPKKYTKDVWIGHVTRMKERAKITPEEEKELVGLWK